MKIFLSVLLALALFIPLPALAVDSADLANKIDELSKELGRMKQQMQEMQKKDETKEQRITTVEKTATEAKKPSAIEIGGDYQFRLDSLKGNVPGYMQYTGAPSTGYMPMMPGMLMNLYTAGQPHFTAKNDTIMLNRFGLNLKARATEDVTVKARLLMYKTFGGSDSSAVTSTFFSPEKSGVFDGNVSHIPQDNTLRVDQAFATWSNVFNAPVWFSIGRRPSTGGVPSNLRRNAEPLGSAGVPALLIDYAFDGMTLGVAPDIEALPGAFAKLCYGRGFDSGYRVSGMGGSLKDTDMIGINVTPYSADNLRVELQWNRAFNMMSNPPIAGVWGDVQANVGDIDQLGTNVMGKINDLGPGDLNLFASAAMSKTHPNNNGYQLPFYDVCIDANMNNICDPAEMQMIANPAQFGLLYDDVNFGGEKKGKTGTAFYLGARYDIKSTATKIGAEYNHGSKNWISFGPANDDLISGKLGTRGDVFETYVIQELKQKAISKYGKAYFRLGYQHYKFAYTGSNGWLGAPKKISDLTATPTTMADFLATQMYSPLKKASNIYLTFNVEF
ncbi:MAG: DUF3373 domain-containing protein [Nitrospira bacterium HGW-Nitrospira-1]|nr:MAG: DUF3373 domain-containing protein [Nitrospira bacterium HGW-Nitrospira-1]